MLLRIFSLLSLGLGVFVLVQVVMPFVAYKAWEMSFYSQNTLLVDPVPNEQALSFGNKGTVLGVSISNVGNFPAIVSNSNRSVEPPYKEFILSIPKINLQAAKVLIDTNEFEKNLSHLPGSALPGEKGNVFVAGHSSLEQLFKQDNYKAILANLPHVKKGDEVLVTAAGTVYRYVVEGLKIVNPSETWVVNPPDSMGRYLSIMTCVPPGFNTKRLVVLAKLQS